ncbi:MAG: transporter substrate-binding domain-containing protein [Alkalibacterium sp.]|nr:transporter substrate-binding domain-containing protein [Alkalibacterium sp.]
MPFGFRQEDDELREQFNASIEQLMEDGTYDDIYKTWFRVNNTNDRSEKYVMVSLTLDYRRA